LIESGKYLFKINPRNDLYLSHSIQSCGSTSDLPVRSLIQ